MSVNNMRPAAEQANGVLEQNVQSDYNTIVQNLCSGYGQYHSPTAKNKPRPLFTITMADIKKMATNPPSQAKGEGQWFIPSTLLSRNFAEQHAEGLFWALWADIDEPDGTTFDDLVNVANSIIFGDYIAHTSRSATEEEQKARLIIPLAHGVDGAEWLILQKILNDKLKKKGIKPDRATERTGQLCYLPNRGEFYAYHVEEFIGVFYPGSWSDLVAEEKEKEQQRQAELKQQRAESLRKAQERHASGQFLPIDSFNQAHDLEMMLRTYSYKKRGSRYLSPLSQSGNAGVSVKGNRWISSHENDLDNGLGKASEKGKCSGDAFDLYAFFEHGNDRNAAAKAVADMLDPEGQKERQREHMAAKAAAEALAAFQSDTEADPMAEEAVDLFNTMEPPKFRLDLLPPAIADYAQDQAELIGVDPSVIAMAAIGVAAASIDDRLEIQPKRYDTGWREQARLWIGIIGDPSAKKSPGIAKAMAPLFKIDKVWREQTNKAMAEWLKACDETPKGEQEPPAPIGKRLILNDATIEKMGDILSKCEPRGILSYQDELSGWLASMDAYKNGAGGKDKAAWLEAYNGGHKAIDRIGRGSIFVENWSACVIGGIQPSVVQAYASSTNHDGMLQRFILVKAGEARLGADRHPNTEARERYHAVMENLTSLWVDDTTVIKLSEEAHVIRENLDAKIHKLVLSHPNKFLTAALGKWGGLFARLLLTFHCIEKAMQNEYPSFSDVSGDTAKKVANLMWFTLLPHAVSFYQGLDPVEDTSRELAALLLAREWPRFTVKRDLNRNWPVSRKMKPWELDETLDRLEAFGWIYPEEGTLNERGRPVAYLVNPGIHVRFKEKAERERERRKEVTALMAELKQ